MLRDISTGTLQPSPIGRYAFFRGNGLWSLAAISPVPRYAPQFSCTIAKLTYNLVDAARHIYGDTSTVSDSPIPGIIGTR